MQSSVIPEHTLTIPGSADPEVLLPAIHALIATQRELERGARRAAAAISSLTSLVVNELMAEGFAWDGSRWVKADGFVWDGSRAEPDE